MAQPNGTGPQQAPQTTSNSSEHEALLLPPTLDADITALAAFLSATSDSSITGTETENRELSREDVAALLQQLERADGVARGVENRLDEILNGLDGLLGEIGPEDGTGSNARGQ